MLDMGFADAIKKIIETIQKQLDEGKDFQRVLLSATPTTGEQNGIFPLDVFVFFVSVEHVRQHQSEENRPARRYLRRIQRRERDHRAENSATTLHHRAEQIAFRHFDRLSPEDFQQQSKIFTSSRFIFIRLFCS